MPARAPGSVWAVVPAAGRGSRMQADRPKQYLTLCNRPVLLHTLDRLASFPRIRGIALGIASQDSHWQTLQYVSPKLVEVYAGGNERAQTVLNGLKALDRHAGPQDWVMVHDAARPCVRHRDLDRLLAAAMEHADGALLAVPVSDTVKRADAGDLVQETVSRAGLWRAQTPQLFPIGVLRSALDRALTQGVDLTDEASAMEWVGARPRLVRGSADNLKITLPEDLALAALVLQAQEQEVH